MKKKITFERIGIILFCVTIIGGGIFTLKGNIQTIKENINKGYSKDKLSGMISAAESSINDLIYGKSAYINLFGLTSKLLNKHYVIETSGTNNVIKDNNGQLHFLTFPVDLDPYVEEVSRVKAVLDEMDIPLLYVQTPIKVIEDYTEIPVGLDDYSKENTDQFLKRLKEASIETLDLRQAIEVSDLDYSTLFYDTDHHWTTQTAFWGMGQVVAYLNEQFDIDLDPNHFYTNLDHYHLEKYEDSFLGSQGRRVGKYYGGVDDYTLILPNFETDYTVTIKKNNVEPSVREGTFEETIIHKNLIQDEDIFTNRYASYFGADYPEVILENHKADKDMKVLIFKDSFALPFSAFLSTMVSETRLIDTRYFKGDILDYISQYQPDLVLYVHKSMNMQA